jgi:hypothetical protein
VTGSRTDALNAEGSHPPEVCNVALIPAKIIARLRGTYTSDVAQLSWEWAMRADGQVVCRMTAVNGHRERNAWQPVTQVPAAERPIVRADHTHARAVLAGIARQRGHQVAGLSD